MRWRRRKGRGMRERDRKIARWWEGMERRWKGVGRRRMGEMRSRREEENGEEVGRKEVEVNDGEK